MAPSACSAGRLLIRSTYYYGFNIEDCVFCRPPRVEKFTLSPDNVWYCRLKLLFSPLVLDHLMLLKAGLRAAPREGNSARCPCLICIWKAPCGPGRRHRDHPVQIQRWSTQWSSSLRPQPGTRWLQSQCWRRLPHVLCELVGSGLVQGYVNEELRVIPEIRFKTLFNTNWYYWVYV